MGRFYKAIQQKESELHPVQEERELAPRAITEELRPAVNASKVTPLPALQSVPAEVAREGSINRLTEQLSALTAAQNPVRVLVSGCRTGDGTSTLAAGLAIDMSQRLGLNTILFDAHLRHPTLHHLMLRSEAGSASGSGGLSTRPRATGWPRLDLASAAGTTDLRAVGSELEELVSDYAMVVIDLGVVRLEPGVLSFARPGDPILLCVRYGHTLRRELFTSVRMLNAANRPVSGVVFNAVRSSVPERIRRILGIGG